MTEGSEYIEVPKYARKMPAVVDLRQPSVTEESQEELLKELFDMVLDVKNSKDDWKKNFAITRKP